LASATLASNEDGYDPKTFGLVTIHEAKKPSATTPQPKKTPALRTAGSKFLSAVTLWNLVDFELFVEVTAKLEGPSVFNTSLLLTTPQCSSGCQSKALSVVNSNKEVVLQATLQVTPFHLATLDVEVAVFLQYQGDPEDPTSLNISQVDWRKLCPTPQEGGLAKRGLLVPGRRHMDLILLGAHTQVTHDWLLALPDLLKSGLGLIQTSSQGVFWHPQKHLRLEVCFVGDFHSILSLEAPSQEHLVSTIGLLSQTLPEYIRLEGEQVGSLPPRLRSYVKELKDEITQTIELSSKLQADLALFAMDPPIGKDFDRSMDSWVDEYQKLTRQLLELQMKTDRAFLATLVDL